MRLANLRRLVVAGVCLGLAGCASSGARLTDNVASLGLPDPVTFEQSAANELEIAPQDRLSINIYPVRDLSISSIRVSGDGTVLVPRLGLVTAQGKTAAKLAEDITAGLAQCCLQRPQVIVQIEESTSRQVTVVGAVKTSNVYNLRGRATLLQAISMAGGVDSTVADMKRVGIVRRVNGQRAIKVFSLNDIQTGRTEDPEVYGGDYIVVGASDTKNVWNRVLQTLPLTAFFQVF